MKKRWYQLVSFTLILMLLAACSSNSGSGSNATPTPQASEGATESSAPAAEPVEITWWNFPNFQALDGEVGKFEKQIIAAFNEKYPEITVNLEMLSFDGGPEKVNVAIATNTAPDIIYDAPGRIIDWAKQGVLAPINDMFTDEVLADIEPATMNQSKVGDDIVMYPFNAGPFMMAVNKTLFEEMGALDLLPLDRDDRVWSIAEFEAALQAVKDNRPDIIPTTLFAKSQAGDQGTRAFFANFTNTTFLNDTNTEVVLDGTEKAFQWVIDMVDKGLIADGSAGMAASDHNDLFLQGKMAFQLNYSAVLKAQNVVNKAQDFEDILLPFPTGDGSAPKLEPFIGGLSIFDNGDAAKIEASKKFIDFLVNDPEWSVKSLKQTGGLSARNSVSGLYEGSEYAYSELARKFLTTPPTIADGYAEIRTHWFPTLQNVLLKTMTPEEAIADFRTKANESIAKAKK